MLEFPGNGRGKKRDGVHTVNFNYPLIQAAFGQLIPQLPFLYGHRRREVWCSQTVQPDTFTQKVPNVLLHYFISSEYSTVRSCYWFLVLSKGENVHYLNFKITRCLMNLSFIELFDKKYSCWFNWNTSALHCTINRTKRMPLFNQVYHVNFPTLGLKNLILLPPWLMTTFVKSMAMWKH